MKYVKLGSSGVEVSPIVLGCMSYGDATRGGHQWVLNEEESRPFIRRALEEGINFFDTANIYSLGSSEEILGRALKEYGRRDELVIATKVLGRMFDGPNGGGLSRKAILREADASLLRLGVDYIDLYQIHRWDDGTPIEETLEALDSLVRAGKVLYLGASSMYSWQFSKALYLQKINGLAQFITMQDHYNLINREIEREMVGLCLDWGIGLLPYSPLARGRLARPWGATSARTETDGVTKKLYDEARDRSDVGVVQAVNEVADARGVPAAQIATAWVMQAKGVTAPIVGVTKVSQLDDALGALEIVLTPDEIEKLESPYVVQPLGFY